MRLAVLVLFSALAVAAVVSCSDEDLDTAAPTATEAATGTVVPEPTETSARTATPGAVEPTATSIPTQPPVTNRRDCGAIRGTAYLSEEERQWFLANCVVQEPPAQQQPPVQQQPPAQTNCHPSYQGACLLPNAGDYDCAGSSGNGPNYTGRVIVVGPDVFDLDRDGDGVGCK